MGLSLLGNPFFINHQLLEIGMKKYFYWYRTLIGRWAPCIADTPPGPSAEARAPRSAAPPVTLEGSTLDLTLDQCVALWPCPAELESLPKAPVQEAVAVPEETPKKDAGYEILESFETDLFEPDRQASTMAKWNPPEE